MIYEELIPSTIQKEEETETEQDYEIVVLYKKIDSITKTCSKLYFNKILKRLAEETELNIKNSTKESRIKVLVWLSNFHNNKKSFNQMTKQDILDYLNSLRKSTIDDSTQRWIGSYNGRQMILSKFFRWLYSPEEPDQRKRLTTSLYERN